MSSTSSAVFTVRKREPVLVTPAGPTPSELKLLSDIDSQPHLRFHATRILVFRASNVMLSVDPAALFRDALSKALVFYYPVAGRLRELSDGKLAVQCTGEGVLFVEADADVCLDQFGDVIQPPFPCLDQLVHDIGADYLSYPILLLQLTRLSCGGFILATQMMHSMMDATGLVQFLKAVSELARGANSVSVPPVWARERLMARDPPRVTHDHPEYDDLEEEEEVGPWVKKSFFFGPREFTALRKQLPLHIHPKTTRFELLTACVWQCLVSAVGYHDGEEVRARIIVNARHTCSPQLPLGFYGNAIVFPVARATAGELRRHSLAYVVERIRMAKESVTEGYLQSVADLMVLRGRPAWSNVRTYAISNLTTVGLEEVDFGWGAAVYSEVVRGRGRVASQVTSFVTKYRDSNGEDGILVPLNLPAQAIERFMSEIEKMVGVGKKLSAL